MTKVQATEMNILSLIPGLQVLIYQVDMSHLTHPISKLTSLPNRVLVKTHICHRLMKLAMHRLRANYRIFMEIMTTLLPIIQVEKYVTIFYFNNNLENISLNNIISTSFY